MFTLGNESLRIELLDPVKDRSRLGQRFGWGGYIWQIHDALAGPLLAGPEWPSENPSVDNGQGLPEAFRHRTTTGEPLLWRGDVGLAPGAGRLARQPSGATVVTEPCRWEIERHIDRVTFRTEQAAGEWSYQLVRKIELHGRQVLSVSQITNRGNAPLVHEWFAHPFFALDQDGRSTVTLPADTQLPENPGYLLSGGQLTFRRRFEGKDDGCLVHLGLPRDTPLNATLGHPRLRHVRFATSFVPYKCVLWANGNTISLEPFLKLDLAPGETRQWTLTYEFGGAAPAG